MILVHVVPARNISSAVEETKGENLTGENASSKLGINITNHSRLCIETVIVSCFAKSFASIF